MINWKKVGVSIDNQSLHQIDHYFNDLEKVLTEQNLSYKKQEVFNLLENHIIDYISINNIKNIDYGVSLKLLAELGPPEEYSSYSSLPRLVDEVNKQKKSIKEPHNPTILYETVLCTHCNAKNDDMSIYCINCGERLTVKPSKGSIVQFLKSHPYYLLNLFSIFLFSSVEIVFLIFNDWSSILELSLELAFILNELYILPIYYFYVAIHKQNSSILPFELFGSHTFKTIIIFGPVLLFQFLVQSNDQLFIEIFTILLLISPVLFTFFLFYTNIFTGIKSANGIPFKNFNVVLYAIILLFVIRILIFGYAYSTFIGAAFIANLIYIFIFGVESILFYLKDNQPTKLMKKSKSYD